MGSLKNKILFHIILPLIAGCIIYLTTRTQSPIPNFTTGFDHNAHGTSLPARILILSGPDFFWSYSFASALFIWKSFDGPVGFSFFLTVAAIMAFSELIQLVFPNYFTFDIADLVAAILATGLSYFLNRRNA